MSRIKSATNFKFIKKEKCARTKFNGIITGINEVLLKTNYGYVYH